METENEFEEQFKISYNKFANILCLDHAIKKLEDYNMYTSIAENPHEEYNGKKGIIYLSYQHKYEYPNEEEFRFYYNDIRYFLSLEGGAKEVSLKGTKNYDGLWEHFGEKSIEDLKNYFGLFAKKGTADETKTKKAYPYLYLNEQ